MLSNVRLAWTVSSAGDTVEAAEYQGFVKFHDLLIDD